MNPVAAAGAGATSHETARPDQGGPFVIGGSALVERRDSWGFVQPLRLVLDRRGDFPQARLVRAGVVGAEEQL